MQNWGADRAYYGRFQNSQQRDCEWDRKRPDWHSSLESCNFQTLQSSVEWN